MNTHTGGSLRRPAVAGLSGFRAPGMIAGAGEHVSVRSYAIEAVERIESLIREETGALNSSAAFDLAGSNNRKSHSILDFNTAMSRLRPSDIDEEFRGRLAHLRLSLSENMALLKLHLTAAQEISALLSRTAQNADSDGTYSRGGTGVRCWE